MEYPHKLLISLALVFCSILSCSSNPYSGMIIISGIEGNNYLFENEESESLIIYIDGSGYKSVLGFLDSNNEWAETTLSNPLSDFFGKEFDVLIPEKLNFSPGKIYNDDPEVLKRSTVEAIGNSYSSKIDRFLRKKQYDEIIMIGASDGGALLPYIYENLELKNEIGKMVIWSGGGLSQLEEFQILKVSGLSMPEEYRESYNNVDEFVEAIRDSPNATDKFYFGHPYIRWNSFFNYRPMDYLANITIPVLFIHGELDWSTPVESTRRIEESQISDKFNFLYYPKMEHSPSSFSELKGIMKDINKWITE